MSNPEFDPTRSGQHQQSAPFINHDGSVITANPASKTNAPLPFAPPSHPGEIGRLGKYRIQQELGRGGMGAVFLAFDERLQRNIALKVMLSTEADARAQERFLREARAAARIASDHVVAIYEADEIDGVPYISLQYLVGQPLDRLIGKYGTPTIQQIVRIAHETAMGLDAAHQLGLVHRDIKPANLWIEANGRVKILDFGLARQQQSDVQLTASGMIVGTPAFMSPEQGRGLPVDARSDLFSLGGVLYWLCTGQTPFRGETTMALLTSLGLDDPKPIRELNASVPEPLEKLIGCLLSKDPAKRPFSSRDVADELVAIFETLETLGAPAKAPTGSFSAASRQETTSSANEATEPVEPTEPESAPNQRAAPAPAPMPAVEKTPFPKLLVGSLLLAVFALVVVVLVSSSKKTPDTTAGPETPEPKPTPTPTPKDTPPPKPMDRLAAEYVLSVGGTVRVNGDPRDARLLAELPKGDIRLDWVSLDSSKLVTEEGLANFKDCKNVVNLSMSGAGITNAGLANFKNCTNMTMLSLHNNPKVGDAGMVHLKDMKKLTHLTLNGTGVTSEGMANFSGLDLIWLDLGGTKVGDAGLVHFQRCKKLTHLHLLHTQGTNAGMANFRGCNKLEDLSLGGPLVNDEGLANFKDCKELTSLYLFGTQVSDVGLHDLRDKTKLTSLNVVSTKVTPEGARELAKSLPQCQITYTGGMIEPKK